MPITTNKLTLKAERIKQGFKNKLLKSALVVEGEAHKLVAIKTGKLNSTIRTDNVKDYGSIMEVSVEAGGSEAHYARFVELPTKRGVKNFHRHGKVVYVGNGQFFLSRSLKNKRGEVLSILK